MTMPAINVRNEGGDDDRHKTYTTAALMVKILITKKVIIQQKNIDPHSHILFMTYQK